MGKMKSTFIFLTLWVPFEHIIRWNHQIVTGKLVFYLLFKFHCRRIQDAFILPSSFCHLFVQTFCCLCLFIWQPWSWHIISTRFFRCSFPRPFTYFSPSSSFCSSYCSFIHILLFYLIPNSTIFKFCGFSSTSLFHAPSCFFLLLYFLCSILSLA